MQNNKKKIIVCIVGASGSGKTTLAQGLEDKYILPTIHSYTTRPMREGEINGVEHIFVDSMPSDIEKIAYTFFGGYHYWATVEQVEKHDIVSYVIDEDGVRFLVKNFADRYHIVVIKVVRKDVSYNVDKDRLDRDNGRHELPDECFSAVVYNNGDINDLMHEGVRIVFELKTLSEEMIAKITNEKMKWLTN